ncbi:hypothetical protein [Jatrophihabitans sp. GAS493]|nr:hypothetical protein [Jatrophihabitans sp. GAS493]
MGTDQAAEQAHYLIGMITRDQPAGYLRLPHPDDPLDADNLS